MILQATVSITTSLFAWLITPSERLATKALVGISEVVVSRGCWKTNVFGIPQQKWCFGVWNHELFFSVQLIF